MGSCWSGFAPPHILDVVDGNEDAYQQRYLEDPNNIPLGEGEFGVVKLVHDKYLQKQQQQQKRSPPAPETTTSTTIATTTQPLPTDEDEVTTQFACKILQKGVVFKDNVLYTPLQPHVLRGEIQMLRTLAGQAYCLTLRGVYESTKRIYIITECCRGGTMTQYVAALSSASSPSGGNSSNSAGEFTMRDVSRIAYQLLLAVQHCAKYHILHRDIKPDNIMFVHPHHGADIRLIDFGSGCMDSTTTTTTTTTTPPNKKKVEYVNGHRVHTTFAGSAFYISPELYNRSYTLMTDIWSVGVTLYVLVAGYPADALQKAFNILQTDTRDLHTLPNLPTHPPEDMNTDDDSTILPESFFALLNGCLAYWYQHRPNATQLLEYEFIKLHLQPTTTTTMQTVDDVMTTWDTPMMDDDDDEDDKGAEMVVHPPPLSRRTASDHYSLRGSVLRHNIFLNFQQYERSLTALLATLLSKSELEQLVFVLNKRVMVRIGSTNQNQNSNGKPPPALITPTIGHRSGGIKEQQQLAVVPISELKSILCDDLLKEEILDQIDKLSLDRNQYDNFAYHTALLNDFVIRNQATKSDGLTSSAHFLRVSRNGGLGGSIHQMTGSNASSVNSTSSRRGSIGNKNVFKSISTKKKANAPTTTISSSMKRSVSTSAF